MNQKLIDKMLCMKIAEKLKEVDLFEDIETIRLTQHTDYQYGELLYFYTLNINNKYPVDSWGKGAKFSINLNYAKHRENTEKYYFLYKVLWDLKIRRDFIYERSGVISFGSTSNNQA